MHSVGLGGRKHPLKSKSLAPVPILNFQPLDWLEYDGFEDEKYSSRPRRGSRIPPTWENAVNEGGFSRHSPNFVPKTVEFQPIEHFGFQNRGKPSFLLLSDRLFCNLAAHGPRAAPSIPGKNRRPMLLPSHQIRSALNETLPSIWALLWSIFISSLKVLLTSAILPIVLAMRIVLYGQSAFSYWLTAGSCTPFQGRLGKRMMKDCEPTPESVAYLEQSFPFLPQPYHLWAPARNKKRLSEAVSHISVYRHSSRILCRVGRVVFAASPELCLAQMTRGLSFFELLLATNALCSIFRKSHVDGHLEKRRPLSSKKKILTFLEHNPRIPGSKDLRAVLPWITENTASPPEAILAMMLRLPFRLGGFQLDGFETNRRLSPSQKAQVLAERRTLVPDILFETSRLVLEYDSTAEHTSALQLARDAKKRMALEADGYKVITVTAKQLRSDEGMQQIAKQIYHHMGLRFRPQSSAFASNQRKLLQATQLLDRHFRSPIEAVPHNGCDE